MTATQEFFAFLSTALIMALSCKADLLPELSGLTYKWVDPLTLNLSWTWKEPKDRQNTFYFRTHIVDECRREARCQQAGNRDCSVETCSSSHNIIFGHLLSERSCGAWKASVQVSKCALCDQQCGDKSTPVNITIYTPKTAVPRDELVKNFMCLTDGKLTRCSWIPVNAAAALNVTYRFCNQLSLKVCDQPHSNSCVLKDDPIKGDICMSVQTATAISTFQIAFKVPVPKMNINMSDGYLYLDWEPLEKLPTDIWVYTVHYEDCNKKKVHLDFSSKEQRPFKIPYNKNCRYDFEYSVKTDSLSKSLTSISNGTASYDAAPDWTSIVIAVVIPIILSACVLLSCFCFRRYREIICPVLPDPSQIFKDFMNGNRTEELKIPTSVCEPETEIFVPCEISPVSEESILQQSF